MRNNNSNNDKKLFTNTDNPTFTNNKERVLAKDLVNEFEALKTNESNAVEEVRKGNILTKQIDNISEHNKGVIEGKPGDILEVKGSRETNTISVAFEKPDGSLAYEVVSSPTPPGVDREEYYDNHSFLWGDRENPGPTESNLGSLNPESEQVLPSIESDDNSKNKRKLEEDSEESIEETENKRSKKKYEDDDSDDNDKGNGSGLGGSASKTEEISTTEGVDSSGPVNFKNYLKTSIIIILDGVLSSINDFFMF